MVAVSLLNDEQERLGFRGKPIALLLPLEAQELILEIIRLRMLSEVTDEIKRLKRILTYRSMLQALTTIIISLALIAYSILAFVGRVPYP